MTTVLTTLLFTLPTARAMCATQYGLVRAPPCIVEVDAGLDEVVLRNDCDEDLLVTSPVGGTDVCDDCAFEWEADSELVLDSAPAVFSVEHAGKEVQVRIATIEQTCNDTGCSASGRSTESLATLLCAALFGARRAQLSGRGRGGARSGCPSP